jgi:chaperonin GroES
MEVKPLHDGIIVQRVEEAEQKVRGVVLPETAKERPQQGKVISVGVGQAKRGHRVELDVKEGDTILFGKYSGQEIKIQGEEFLVLREEEVLSVLDAAPTGRHTEPDPRSAPAVAIKTVSRHALEARLTEMQRTLGARSWLLDCMVSTPFLVAASVPATSVEDLASVAATSSVLLNVSLFVPEDLALSNTVFVACHPSGAIRGLSASASRENSEVMLHIEDLLALLDPDDPRQFAFPTLIDSEVLVIGVSPGVR